MYKRHSKLLTQRCPNCGQLMWQVGTSPKCSNINCSSQKISPMRKKPAPIQCPPPTPAA